MSLTRDIALEQLIVKKFGKFKIAGGGSGTSYRICCPFRSESAHIHKPDKGFKMYISPGPGLYHCFVCNRAGLISELLEEFKKGTVNEATTVAPLNTDIVLPGTLIKLNQLHPDSVGIRYIVNRGFDPEYLTKHYNIQYCTAGRIFGGIFNTSHTIVIPIVLNGNMVGWQSRLLYTPETLSPDQYSVFGFKKDEDGDYILPPKYFTSPGLDKGRILFNYDNARKFNHVVICEGPFDAMRVGLNAVATLGKGVSDAQIRLIKSYWQFAIILLDPDAEEDMYRLERELQLGIKCIVVKLKNYKDAGEAPTDEIWNQIITTMERKNLNVADYLKL